MIWGLRKASSVLFELYGNLEGSNRTKAHMLNELGDLMNVSRSSELDPNNSGG